MQVHFLGEHDDGISISSHHAQTLTGLGVSVTFSRPNSVDVSAARNADVVHLITRGPWSHLLFRDVLRVSGLGIPIARFWTGEDLLWAQWHAPSRAAAHALARVGVHQFCRSENELAQLETLGIAGQVLPPVSINVSVRSKPQPMPRQLTLLCFLPADKFGYYGGELVESFAHWLPDVRFLVVGESLQSANAQNVENLGRVNDIGRSLLRSTAVIHARRDHTLSRMVIEALSHGRHAITGCDFPHTLKARTTDHFLDAVRRLQRAPSFNLAGREEVGRRFDRRMTGEALQRALCSICEIPAGPNGGPGKWLRTNALMGAPEAVELDRWPALESLPPEADAFKTLLSSTVDARANLSDA